MWRGTGRQGGDVEDRSTTVAHGAEETREQGTTSDTKRLNALADFTDGHRTYLH